MGKTTLPAGDYLFDYSSRLLVVHQQDGQHTTAMALALSVSRPKAPATGIVEINRYGDAYFLAKLWTPSSPRERQCPRQRVKRSLPAGQLQVKRRRLSYKQSREDLGGAGSIPALLHSYWRWILSQSKSQTLING